MLNRENSWKPVMKREHPFDYILARFVIFLFSYK